MKREKLFSLVLALLFLLMFEKKSKAASAGQTAGTFLTIPPEAKSAGLAGAYSAEATGATALWYNPATMSRNSAPSIMLTHSLYLESLMFDAFSAVYPFGSSHAVGLGIEMLNAGSISSYDNTGQALSAYSPRDLNIRLGYSKTWDRTSVGLVGHFTQSTIQETASTLAYNFGVHQDWEPVGVGLSMENLGGKLVYRQESNPLPRRLKGAVSWHATPLWSINTELVKPVDEKEWAALGTEYHFFVGDEIGVAVRAGYNTESSNELKGLHGFAVGTGAEMGGTELNYAWVPFGDLGSTHRISLGFQFAGSLLREEKENNWEEGRGVIAAKSKKLSKGKDPSLRKMAFYPWKNKGSFFRSANERVMELLARDAICGPGAPHALIARTKGTVTIKTNVNSRKEIRTIAGKYVFQDDVLRTRANSIAQIVFANGTIAEVRPNSILSFEESPVICERPIARLVQGEITALGEANSDLEIKTPLGELQIKSSKTKLNWDGQNLSMKVFEGTASWTAEGQTVSLHKGMVYSANKDKKLHGVVDREEDAAPVIDLNSALSDPAILGRWDTQFANQFKEEIKKLDSMPGVSIAEYVRDTKLRDEVKLSLFDLKLSRDELIPQIEELKKDVANFTELRTSLKTAVLNETNEQKKERKLALKHAKLAGTRAQASLKEMQQKLRGILVDLHLSEEILVTLPIIRMLNITAKESTIPFDSSRALIPEESKSTLDSIADSIAQLKPSKIVVEGHTDKIGSASVNNKLSKQRAEAVARYLQQKTHLPLQRFETKGMGASRPIMEGDSPGELSKNRRVEIWLELRGL